VSAAFRVKYRGPTGDCPDAVVTFRTGDGECAADVAKDIKKRLVDARGGAWKEHEVTVRAIEYLGPWFREKD
jgi:hypothetical protein